MVRGRFYGDDIDIYLSQEEANSLGFLEIDWTKKGRSRLIRMPLEVMLEIQDDKPLKVIIQKQDFDDLGDGIQVERTDYGFFIRINDKAYLRIVDQDLSGTRYDGMNKINFHKEINLPKH